MRVDYIHVGDAKTWLESLPNEAAHCIVTSPPYFGHRVYSRNDSREIGRETSVNEYIERLTNVLLEARRVLRADGTLWLNIGDTYRDGHQLGVPWRVALSLAQQGWVLRSDIIWHKPNAMPSSIRNRPTPDHEYMFLFSRNGTYYYDCDAIREEHVTFTERSKMRGGRNHFGKRNSTPERGKNAGNSNLHDARWDQAFHPLGRNKRTVWSVALGKNRQAHFAVFPERLIEPCILAGSPLGGVVLDPFLGSGTTAAVALKTGRHFLGCELVPEYAKLAEEKIAQVQAAASLFSSLG